jgi:hypothetical protein
MANSNLRMIVQWYNNKKFPLHFIDAQPAQLSAGLLWYGFAVVQPCSLKPLYTLLGMILQYFIKLDFLDVSHSS